MPVDMSLYPANWREISLAVKERAGWRCEWCGLEHNAEGYRDRHGRFFPLGVNEDPPRGSKRLKICLTTAHLGVPKPDGSPGDKHDKMDCRPENLAGLCQYCHLNYDRPDHIRARRLARRSAQVRKGQLEMKL